MTKETQKLCKLFKALGEAKDVLGDENWMDIRLRLAEGSMYKTMFPAMIKENRRLTLNQL